MPVTLPCTSCCRSQITDVVQDQGGDSRWVTMTIRGARFQPDALVKLVRPGHRRDRAERYEVIDATTHHRHLRPPRRAARRSTTSTVINPNGATGDRCRTAIWSRRALEIDVTIGLGGPRVLPAGQTGLYGISLQSLTNVDTPYVYFEFGAPEIGDNAMIFGLPFVTFNSNVRGSPDGVRTDVPWASLDSEVNLGGCMLASGYALDVTAGGFVGMSFSVAHLPGPEGDRHRDFDGFQRALYDARPEWQGGRSGRRVESTS